MFLTKIPTRLTVPLILFTAVIINYTMRLNLSVSIVQMVPVIGSSSNDTKIKALDLETLGWSVYERALVLGAYSWSYTVANVISGPMSERFGPRLVVLVSTLASVILTMASPAAAKTSYVAMVILRVALGFFGGFLPPASQKLIASWAVEAEKGLFSGIIMGGTIGAVITWSLSGILIEAFGWEWAFYAFGISATVWCALWWLLIYNTPEKHPRISKIERQFIMDGTSGINNTKSKTPYAQILCSVPVWASTIAFFGSGWGSSFSLYYSPMFISNVLKYNLTATGFLSSISYVLRSFGSVAFGLLGDFLVRRKCITLRSQRKLFLVISHFIPGCAFIMLTFNNDAPTAIALIAIAMGMNSAISVSLTRNCLDLAPKFAGTVFGIGNGCSSLVGIITPFIVAYFTKDDETSFEAWQPLFYIAGLLFILTGSIYMIFGSMELQPWNNIESCDNKNSTNQEISRL